MKDLHDRPIDPLPPPPGSFDHMMKSARGRRRRQAMAVLSSAAALVLVASGAFALGNTMGRSNNVITRTVADGGRSDTASSAPPSTSTSSPTTPATHKPHKRHPKKQQTDTTDNRPAKVVVPPASTATVTTTTTATASATPIIHLRGRVTDPDGNPLSGVYVLPGFPDTAAFAPHNGAFTQTNGRGEFDIACPRSPVYLATWPLNRPITVDVTGADYAPAWFAAPAGSTGSVVPTCGRARKTTVLQPIAPTTIVTGTVGLTPDSTNCAPDKTFTVGVWLYGNKSRSVRVNGRLVGTVFAFRGLPDGTHVLNASGNTTSITVKNGVPVTANALFTCHGPPTAPESPTPTPTPSDTTSPSPPTPPVPTLSTTP